MLNPFFPTFFPRPVHPGFSVGSDPTPNAPWDSWDRIPNSLNSQKICWSQRLSQIHLFQRVWSRENKLIPEISFVFRTLLIQEIPEKFPAHSALGIPAFLISFPAHLDLPKPWELQGEFWGFLRWNMEKSQNSSLGWSWEFPLDLRRCLFPNISMDKIFGFGGKLHFPPGNSWGKKKKLKGVKGGFGNDDGWAQKRRFSTKKKAGNDSGNAQIHGFGLSSPWIIFNSRFSQGTAQMFHSHYLDIPRKRIPTFLKNLL